MVDLKERYEVDWEDGNKYFATYKGAFNFYMKLREGKGFEWLYVFDQLKNEYLITENCYAG